MTWRALLDRLHGRITERDLIRLGASLLLALLLWGWVTRTENPEISRTYDDLSITAGTLPEALRVVTTLPKITVRLTGPRSVIDDIPPSKVEAHLKLKGVDGPGSYRVPVEIKTPGGVRKREADPAQIQIQVEQIVSRQFPLTVQKPQLADNTRQIGEIHPEVSQITVSGPSSVVGRVVVVVLPVDIKDKTEDFYGQFTPVARDAAGHDIPEAQVRPDTVSAFVPIKASGKSVAVIAVVSGEPAPGYQVVDRTVNPPNVIVDGPSDTLANLISIQTTPVDIAGAVGTVSRHVGLDLPPGVRLVQPSEPAVDVVVQISKRGVVQPLTGLHVTVTGVGDGLTVAVSPKVVAVTVVAAEDVLPTLNSGAIGVQVDVSGLGPGVYPLTPRVTVPPNVQWLSIDPAVITVTIAATPAASPASVPPAASPHASPVVGTPRTVLKP